MLTAHIRRIVLGVLFALLTFTLLGMCAGIILMILVTGIGASIGGVYDFWLNIPLIRMGAFCGAVIGFGFITMMLIDGWESFVDYMIGLHPMSRF